MSGALELTAEELRRDPLFFDSPLPKWIFDDASLAFLAVNAAAVEHYGWSEAEFLRMTLEDIRPTQDLGQFRRLLHEHGLSELAYYPVVRHLRRDGTVLHTELHSRAVVYEGRAAHLVVARDVSARIEAERALRLHATAVEASPNGVLVTDARLPGQPIVLVNPAFERITGYPAAEVLGRNCRFLQGEDRDQPVLAELRAALAARRPFHGVLRNYRRDGEMFWNELHLAPAFDETGELTHYVGIQNDVTQSRIEALEREYRDRHDELTGLPNRRSAEDAIAELLAADGGGRVVEVSLVNLDLFHQVNDTLGFETGDAVIREVAQRALAVAARYDAFAGRIGADDFLLVARRPAGAPPGALAEEVVAAIGEPFLLAGSPIHLTATAGTAVHLDADDSTQALIQRAHLATKKAKQAGRNQVAHFTPEMASAVSERLLLGAALREAIASRQFSLHVQPLVQAASGRLSGGEALLRWSHPVHGAISPLRFIPVAEDSGLIVPIGRWTLEEALRLAGAWSTPPGSDARTLAVNVSAVQFRRRSFVRDVLDAVAASGLAAHALKLEITEGTVMEDAEQAIGMLHELREGGVRISLDDFGTGHSSLGYLRTLPLDELKMDRLFVRDVTVDPYAARLCRAIIEMSRQLGLAVVAEGVETPAQAEFLRAAGCDLLQGYLFSRPLPADAFRDLTRRDAHWSLTGTPAVADA
jgi:diguanylate cyclase (GGDEF)-like protein/PAS domain S-box-containing protein